MTTSEDFWNQRYSSGEYVYGIQPNAYFKSIIDGLTPGSLLVPAAGEGRDAVYAARLGWDVTAYDQSSAGRNKALELAKEHHVNLRYEVADALSFRSDEQAASPGKEQKGYDAIVLSFFHLPPDLRKTVHRQMVKLLNPGGHVILQAFNPLQLNNTSGGPKESAWLFTSEILAEDFGELTILQNEESVEELDEGSFHKGRADVLRFLAFKGN